MTISHPQAGGPAAAIARIDLALDRLETALSHGAAQSADTARHERLRSAVASALGQLDALIGARQADGEA